MNVSKKQISGCFRVLSLNNLNISVRTYVDEARYIIDRQFARGINVT